MKLNKINHYFIYNVIWKMNNEVSQNQAFRF